MKKLHAFMMRHLRSIKKIRWQDKVTNIKVLKRAGLHMEDLLIRNNLRWTGHLLRMPTDRLPRQVLYSQLPDGQQPRGRPRLRYKDTIKRNIKKRDIDTNSWKLWRYSKMYGETQLTVCVLWEVVLLHGMPKTYNDKNRHKCNSEYTCSMCKKKACLYKPSYTSLCKECFGVFGNSTCLNHHKQNEVCARATSCEKCGHWFARPITNHICESLYCTYCNKEVIRNLDVEKKI